MAGLQPINLIGCDIKVHYEVSDILGNMICDGRTEALHFILYLHDISCLIFEERQNSCKRQI